MRTKIDYGIHITPTFACMARMENSEPVVVKSDALKDTLPMCVGFSKKGNILVGDAAWSNMRSEQMRQLKTSSGQNSHSFIEFTRTLGTNKTYTSSHVGREFTSEELLAEVLKKMKAFVADEEINAVVLTCPAKFDIPQKDALVRSGKLAGFKQVELVHGSIAASMAYGLNCKNKNGYWVVFDFNEGWFDASLIKVEEGFIKVVDTDGDNYLGDGNLVIAIVDEIILPYLQEEYVIDSILEDEVKRKTLREALKYYAEEAKEQLNHKDEHWLASDLGDIPGEDDEGEEFELGITINREKLKNAIAPIFHRAIDITKDLNQRNNLSGSKLDALILVGGPTYSPILREMLEEQIKKPDASTDPITAVATGAALYASTLDVSDEIKEVSQDKTKIQLDIGYAPSTVETEEWIALKILPGKTEGTIPEKVFAEIARADKAWQSERILIDDKGEVAEVKLNEGQPNLFILKLYDQLGTSLHGEPNHFTIRHGYQSGNATLNHSIGIAADTGKSYEVFLPIKGLEKNVSLPAQGTINGLKCKQDVRPGTADIALMLPLYQGEHGSEGSRAIYNKHIYDVIITGDDLPSFLSKGSDIDITISTDRSSGQICKLEAYFPSLDYCHEVVIPENPPSAITKERLGQELETAEATIERLKGNSIIEQNRLSEIEKEVAYQRERFDQFGAEMDQRNEILSNLRRVLIKLDRSIEAEAEITPDDLKQKLIDLYSEHPEIPKEKFKALFDELFEFSGNGSMTEGEMKRLKEIKKEINELI